MKITVFGATGGTGLELLRQGLERAHDVTAVVRDAGRLPADLRDRLDVVETDLMNPEAIAPTVKGRDAVLSALGSRERGPTTVQSAGIGSILAAMRQTGTRRLLMVGAAGLEADAGDGPFTRYVLKPLVIQRLFRHSYADLARAERLLRDSDADWTIVRPARLTDAGRTSSYRTARDLSIRGGLRTTRADTAHCMLELIGDRTSIGHVISVAS
ncbi:NAD(P)-dependent oxidoreductase [Nonomuraea gerenzanensis]|uniref:Flavin reductase n=1 Tax=Nonomuraea gerenzanensis TaxID=93944 RepID=A0A1M4ECX4_9ACTN|nr:SDR family oxidoreductase [Nonomuraea gerenzanensis]UBU18706.1 SDR family oxidoreductase [Nonomuraea gerenzanensis]SBO96566.1 Flavin reductase [Nonomuraea gerenzanensis]